MRRVGDHLHCLLIPFALTLVYRHRQDNSHREIGDKGVKSYNQCVLNKPSELVRGNKRFKMFHPYPLTSSEPPGRHKIFKRDLKAIHGAIAEDQQDEYREGDNHIQLPVLFQLMDDLFCLASFLRQLSLSFVSVLLCCLLLCAAVFVAPIIPYSSPPRNS